MRRHLRSINCERSRYGSVNVALRTHLLRQAEELLKVGVRPSDDTFVVAQADGSPFWPDT
jgi:hypothetical protein